MKTAELTGGLLALWVARANSWSVELDGEPGDDYATMICIDAAGCVQSFGEHGYRPDLNWAQGGPIIELGKIELRISGVVWWADRVFPEGANCNDWCGYGITPLIAAMRAFVASVYGESVPDDPLANQPQPR